MTSPKPKYISAMLIFGSVGLLVRHIALPAAQIALTRGVVGCLFLLAAVLITRRKVSWPNIHADLWVLLASGAAIGINWIFLFESYARTTIATATICYYMAPVLVVFLSPLVLKEKLTKKKIVCIAAAVAGIVLISDPGSGGAVDMAGIFYGLAAALFYAAVIMLNKFLRQVSDFERSIFQLAFAALVLLPYVLSAVPTHDVIFDITSVILLFTLGVVHTGFAYYLYFSGLRALKAQTAALLGYIDPLAAILLSALILSERMGPWQMVGGVLILGGAMFCESFTTS